MPREIAQKRYVIVRSSETVRVTVPASWKVTFGPGVPMSGKNGQQGWALRFYEAKDKQRAIFTDVKAFWDTSIAIEKKVEVKVTGGLRGPRRALNEAEMETHDMGKAVFTHAGEGEWGPTGRPQLATVDEYEALTQAIEVVKDTMNE